MYKIIIKNFDGKQTTTADSNSFITIKQIYANYINRCLTGFTDISEVHVLKDNDIVSSFINWKR